MNMSYLNFMYPQNITDVNTLRSNLQDRYWFKHEKEYFECAKIGRLYEYRQQMDKVVERVIRTFHKNCLEDSINYDNANKGVNKDGN